MPAYAIEFTTDRGPQRLPFTLDADRALAPQLAQILEELRQRGLVVRGGPGDEAGAYWNGAELDQRRSPDELGISPSRPLEIRMRRAAPKAAPLPPEPPPRPFLAKGGVASAMAGVGGALVAWIIAGMWDDLGELLFSYQMLDLATATLLGTFVAGAVGAADAARNGRAILPSLLITAALGAVGGALGGFATVLITGLISPAATMRTFLLLRIVAWGIVGAAVGGVIGLAYVRSEPRRMVDGLAWGVAGGLVAGLLYSLPGPSDLWNALAFTVFGAAIGAGLCGPALQRSHAILERELARGGPFRLFGIREWGLRPSSSVALRDGGVEATVEGHDGAFVLRPRSAGSGAAAIRVGGQAVATGVRLRNGDVLDVAGARYVFRRLRAS